MSSFFLRPLVGLLFLPVAGLAVAADASLTLHEAVRLALARDAMLAQYTAQAEAARNDAVAAGAWPDPELSFGVQNLPTDSFALDADPMTMVMLGIRQQIPAGDSADLREQIGVQRAQSYLAQAAERRRAVTRAMRSLWYRLGYAKDVLATARATQSRFATLLETATAQYAQGGSGQAAVLRTQMALDSVTEEILQQETAVAALRAELVRWLTPEVAEQPLAKDAALPPINDYASLVTGLPQHPVMLIQQTGIDISRTGIALAEETYAPEWAVSVQYGARQGYSPMSNMPNGDMVTAMLSMSLPLFTGDRQDRRVAAARAQSRATEFAYQDTLRRLRAQLDIAWAEWQHALERETLYQEHLLPAAVARVQAARAAYQAGEADLQLLIDAQLAALQTRIGAARSLRDRALAQAELLYFSGDEHE